MAFKQPNKNYFTDSATTLAPQPVVDLRLHQIIPYSVQHAKERVAQHKKLYQSNTFAEAKKHNRELNRNVMRRFRLAKSVRNVKIEKVNSEGGGSGSGGGVAGTLCVPFASCTALSPVVEEALLAQPSHTSYSGSSGCCSSLMATGSVDGLVTVWDTTRSCRALCSASTIQQGTTWGRVRALVCHAQAPLLFSATMFQQEPQIAVWTVAQNNLTMAPLATTTDKDDGGNRCQHTGVITDLAIDPSGSLLASASADDTYKLWDLRHLTHTGTRRSEDAASAFLYTQDGYATSPAPRHTIHRGLSSLHFHPDGALLSTADAGGRIVTWDLRSGRVAFVAGGPLLPTSKDGSSGSSTATAAAKHGTRSTSVGHLGRATCVRWSPCGVRFASAGADHVVHLWDSRRLYQQTNHAGAGAGQSVVAAPIAQLLGHEDVVTSLAFHPGDSHALLCPTLTTTSLDHQLKFWDLDTGVCVRTVDAGAPLYQQCYVKAAEAEQEEAAAAAAAAAPLHVCTVGRSKYWSLWAAPSRQEMEEEGEGDGGDASSKVVVTETETTVLSAAHAHAATVKAEKGEDESDEEEEDEEDDEMTALRQAKAKAPATAHGKTVNEEEEDEESEDEMNMLKK